MRKGRIFEVSRVALLVDSSSTHTLFLCLYPVTLTSKIRVYTQNAEIRVDIPVITTYLQAPDTRMTTQKAFQGDRESPYRTGQKVDLTKEKSTCEFSKVKSPISLLMTRLPWRFKHTLLYAKCTLSTLQHVSLCYPQASHLFSYTNYISTYIYHFRFPSIFKFHFTLPSYFFNSARANQR